MAVNTDAKETIMAEVCAICHWPYVEADQEALDDRCASCPVEKTIEAQLQSAL